MAKTSGFLRALSNPYKAGKAAGLLSEKVTGAQTLVKLFRALEEETKEKLVTISFDAVNKILCFEVIAIGGTNACYARPIEIFKSSFMTGAASAVVLHNHSSGGIKPSISDIAFTRRILGVSESIGLKLLDHILIGFDGFYSFASQGRLTKRFE